MPKQMKLMSALACSSKANLHSSSVGLVLVKRRYCLGFTSAIEPGRRNARIASAGQHRIRRFGHGINVSVRQIMLNRIEHCRVVAVLPLTERPAIAGKMISSAHSFFVPNMPPSGRLINGLFGDKNGDKRLIDEMSSYIQCRFVKAAVHARLGFPLSSMQHLFTVVTYRRRADGHCRHDVMVVQF